MKEKNIPRRTIIQAGSAVIALSGISTSSAQGTDETPEEISISKRLLPDISVKNKSKDTRHIKATLYQEDSVIFEYNSAIESNSQHKETEVFPNTRQIFSGNKYRLVVQSDGKKPITRAADAVAAYPDLYRMVIEVSRDGKLYVYDDHVDPSESYLENLL